MNDAGTRPTVGSRRIERAFGAARAEGRLAFIPYVVAGYPDVPTSEDAALAAIDAGADVLELGLPYSDPLADGATLQRASAAALAAGITIDAAFALATRICAARPGTPLVVMGYVNQFLGPRGPTNVAQGLAATQASGAIVADLTPDEGAPLEAAFVAAGLALVYLVAPTTPIERAADIAARGGGFLYCVSLVGVTGGRPTLGGGLKSLVARVRGGSLLPVAVGFGVSRPAHVQAIVRAGADGVIVGSALVDALGPDGRNVARLARACSTLRAAATRN